MNFNCPHCGQSLEADEEWLGHALDCPACGKPFIVGGEMPPAAPPMGIPLPPPQAPAQPAPFVPSAPPAAARQASGSAKHSSAPLPPQKPAIVTKPNSRRGCFIEILIALVLAAGAFGYAMYRNDESPQQVWSNRIQPLIHHYMGAPAATAPLTPTPAPSVPPAPTPPPPTATPEPAATSTPEPTPETTPQATPVLEPLDWLKQHPDRLPKEMSLTKPLEFPAMFNGSIVGSVKVLAGRQVKFVRFRDRETLVVDYAGGSRPVLIADTDFLDLLKKEMVRPAATPTAAPQPSAADQGFPAAPAESPAAPPTEGSSPGPLSPFGG